MCVFMHRLAALAHKCFILSLLNRTMCFLLNSIPDYEYIFSSVLLFNTVHFY